MKLKTLWKSGASIWCIKDASYIYYYCCPLKNKTKSLTKEITATCCRLTKGGLTFQQFHNHHNSSKKHCDWSVGSPTGLGGLVMGKMRGSTCQRDGLKAWPSQNCVYDIFSEGQVFRSAVRWADYLALDSLVTLATPNLALLRFLVKQKVTKKSSLAVR